MGLPSLSPSSCSSPADKETEKRIALVLVHACQQELSALSASSSLRSSRKSSVSDKVASAQTVAGLFRQEKRKVLLGCLDQLTGGTPAAADRSRDKATAAKEASAATASL